MLTDSWYVDWNWDEAYSDSLLVYCTMRSEDKIKVYYFN